MRRSLKSWKNDFTVNYSPHTAWVREDEKQPRVIRHDGLAFVPGPRVYGKLRPAALKDFVANKHLPRAKPRVSVVRNKTNRGQCESAQQRHASSKTTSTNIDLINPKQTTNQTVPEVRKKTSPKKPPPKNLEQILTQSLSRRALGPEKLFEIANPKIKHTAKKDDTKKTYLQYKPIGNRSPMKNSKLPNGDIQFECDTSISLAFDQELNRKTPSPKKSAAKKLETKNVHRKNLNKSVAVLLGRVQILWPGNSEMPYLLAISKTKWPKARI